MGVAPAHQLHQEKEISMSTITVPRTDITSEQIGAALRDGLDDRYDVLIGKRMNRFPIGTPRAAGPDEIVVGKGPSPMVRAQVRSSAGPATPPSASPPVDWPETS